VTRIGSIAFIAGPYVKARRGSLPRSTTTVSMIATIVDILGIEHLGTYDALQPPMTGAFSKSVKKWTSTPIVPDILANDAVASAGEDCEDSLSGMRCRVFTPSLGMTRRTGPARQRDSISTRRPGGGADIQLDPVAGIGRRERRLPSGARCRD